MTPGKFQPGNATPTSRRPVARMAASKPQNQLSLPSVRPAARRPTQATPGRGATRLQTATPSRTSDPGLEGFAEGRVVGDNRLGHRVAISDRAGHLPPEMEGNLKPHRSRVQGILVDERDLEPKPGGLERRRTSRGPGSDHEQLDALARREPLAVGGDRVEPSTQRVIPVPSLQSLSAKLARSNARITTKFATDFLISCSLPAAKSSLPIHTASHVRRGPTFTGSAVRILAMLVAASSAAARRRRLAD